MNSWTLHRWRMRNLFRFAYQSIRRSIARSVLTILSLVIGIAAVIAMTGVGSGARARVQESIAALDLNRLVLSARLRENEKKVQTSFPNGSGISLADYYTIREKVPGVAAISPRLESSSIVQDDTGRHAVKANVFGVDVDGARLEARHFVRGSFFGAHDVRHAATVCVITESVARALFAYSDSTNRALRVNGIPFRVIGIIADDMPTADVAELRNESLKILVPFTSMLQRIDRSTGDRIKILMSVESTQILASTKQRVSNLMEQRRGKRKAEFAILTTADVARMYTASSNTLALLLALISSISLLVGGVGITNVMLMSVKERTRELGIRAALGARRSDVLGQVLLEATLLSLLGGVIGIVLGVGSAHAITRWVDWPLLITPSIVIGAFLSSVCVGAFFGYYPASRAAQLNPIEALRAE